MQNACMVSIQIRDVSEQVRDTLAEVARSQGQSMRVYPRNLPVESARRAANIALLKKVRSIGGGYVAESGEIAREITTIRAKRDRRNVSTP
jgi:CelD/BcsL family acetyltransferase involved in cellulose biosynthesis